MRKILSKTLILLGCLLLVAAVVYEAVNFPWGVYISSVNTDSTSPPQPPETYLDTVDYIEWQPEMAQNPETTETSSGLPGIDTIFTPAAEVETTASPPSPSDPAQTTAPAPKKPQYAIMGSLSIGILGVNENLISGTDGQLLAGVGHMPTTALPGEEGNCAIAGHRNYIRMHPFRHLDKLKQGDEITVNFNGQTFTYSVYESFVVEPSDVWVVDPVEGREKALTLITCDPVVNPVKRLIVRAEIK